MPEGVLRLLHPFAQLLYAALVAGLPMIAVGQTSQSGQSRPVGATDPVSLLIRSDDAGMSHSVNMALRELIESGPPVSISVMFPTPWHQETVELLKRHPDVSVGIHLTLNSEWKHYRWGPVLGPTAVPTLVDAEGYFFPSADALFRNRPNLAEVERELRAQIERAMRSGLKNDYVDYHMGTVVQNPDFRVIAERLAREFGLGMSGYFGERDDTPQYAAPPAQKLDSLVAMLGRLSAPFNLVVTHVGIDDAELGALVDMNTGFPLADMSKHRQGELRALTSARFREAVATRRVRLITYRQLIEQQGLKAMKRPGG